MKNKYAIIYIYELYPILANRYTIFLINIIVKTI